MRLGKFVVTDLFWERFSWTKLRLLLLEVDPNAQSNHRVEFPHPLAVRGWVEQALSFLLVTSPLDRTRLEVHQRIVDWLGDLVVSWKLRIAGWYDSTLNTLFQFCDRFKLSCQASRQVRVSLETDLPCFAFRVLNEESSIGHRLQTRADLHSRFLQLRQSNHAVRATATGHQ